MNDEELIFLERYQKMHELIGETIMNIVENYEARGIDYTNRDTLGPLMLATTIKSLIEAFRKKEPKP